MFGNTINKKETSQVAKELLELLEKYQRCNTSAKAAVKDVLKKHNDLIVRAINMEIDKPIRDGFRPEEFRSDGYLSRYSELEDAAAKFSLLLRGANSIDELNKIVNEIVKQAEQDEIELRKKFDRTD